MARTAILCSAGWADRPADELVPQAAEWGYQGLDLCCWGDHFEVQRALTEDDYTAAKLELLRRHELDAPVLSNLRVGQVVGDAPDPRHRDHVPDYVWGDGTAPGVQQRAVEELIASARAAQRLGAAVLSVATGSALWPGVTSQPPLTEGLVAEGLRDFAHRWGPVLEACSEAGVRLACLVAPGQFAYDLVSAEMVLEAVHGREEFGFTLDPAALHWQGIDPVEFVRRFPERLFHVLVTDGVPVLNGRASLFGSYPRAGEVGRARSGGWQARSPGRGAVDWESLVRALNEVGYEGPLAVAWEDPGMDRGHGADEARKFLQRLDFEPPPRSAFR